MSTLTSSIQKLFAALFVLAVLSAFSQQAQANTIDAGMKKLAESIVKYMKQKNEDTIDVGRLVDQNDVGLEKPSKKALVKHLKEKGLKVESGGCKISGKMSVVPHGEAFRVLTDVKMFDRQGDYVQQFRPRFRLDELPQAEQSGTVVAETP